MTEPVEKTMLQLVTEQRADVEKFKRAAEKVNNKKVGTKFRPNPDEKTLYHGEDADLAADDLFIHSGIAPTYPLEYFIKNNFAKPTLTLPPPRNDIKSGSNGIKTMMYGSNNPTINDLKTFLVTLMSTMKEKCPENWCGLGVEIANKNDEITPLDLFNLVSDEHGQGATGSGFEKNEILPGLILVTGCYRLSLIKNEQYRVKIEKLINDQVQAAGGPANNATKCQHILAPLYADEEILKCFAGLDMYLNRFAKHPYARARVGTIVTRYRDCSALLTLSYITDMVGFGAIDFARWMFVPELSNQYNRMMMCGQDIANEHSYMPYMTCMKLTEKSPYSATVNNAIHLFSHAIGAAMMLTRSINAAFIPCNNQQSVMENAILFFYAQRKTLGYAPQFYTALEKPEVERVLKKLAEVSENTVNTNRPESEGDQSDAVVPLADLTKELADEPKTKDGLAWFKWIADLKCQTPAEVSEVIYARYAAIRNPREGTIGDQMARTAVAELQALANRRV